MREKFCRLLGMKLPLHPRDECKYPSFNSPFTSTPCGSVCAKLALPPQGSEAALDPSCGCVPEPRLCLAPHRDALGVIVSCHLSGGSATPGQLCEYLCWVPLHGAAALHSPGP